MKIYGVSDRQVLQQKNGKAKPVLSGECENDELNIHTIAIQITDEESGEIIMPWTETGSICGRWRIQLNTLYCGRNYKIDIDGISGEGETIVRRRLKESISHVTVGDVYLIAGQSNAAGWAHGRYDEPLDLNVRELNGFGKWDVAAQPLGGGGFSPFITFAKKLSKKLGYPIGLIPRAVGASSVRSWISTGENFVRIKNEKIGKIKGVLWYQGCNEALENDTKNYGEYFMDFALNARKIFKDKNLPIITFQLNRFRNDRDPALHDEGYDRIREIQRSMKYKLDNLYVIPTIDLETMSDAIHNGIQSNISVGMRAAELALDVIYHLQKSDKAPDIADIAAIGDNRLMLTFDNVKGVLYAFEVSAQNLPIAVIDESGENRITDYEIRKNTITVTTERKIGKRTKVKAQYGKNPKNVIIDHDTMLPVLCFCDVMVSL